MRIADVLKNKGAGVLTVGPDMSVADLLASLVTRNVGAMVVVADGAPVGIVSERDVVRRLHEFGADLLARPVSDIMTAEVITCTPGDDLDSLSALMTTNRVRHVPVLENGHLSGIVSIGDVVKTRMEQLEAHQEQLEAYITQG
ncbi:CBS domain-containing protein [Mycolicibacterium arenosum]|uniref:CBS domain-containing protein n=1 Tax=Mycolicibacterium arenosum TaxID=2952157 RepID=A0ABT1M508_9MYCO|nr:CBS domain-containing protein [Mycolicibacterium sp. CAU 1645]MCP9273527.1 CBS domain-containing protein [Mycolicibacterium sp. CAU 1645]